MTATLRPLSTVQFANCYVDPVTLLKPLYTYKYTYGPDAPRFVSVTIGVVPSAIFSGLLLTWKELRLYRSHEFASDVSGVCK